LLTFHCFKKIAMLSNTGGNDRDNSSTGAVVVGDPKCAVETEVSAGVAVLSEAPANCARLDENAAAAKVPTMAELIVTYNPYLSVGASSHRLGRLNGTTKKIKIWAGPWP
jgi:hypothetical protein